MVSFEIFAAVEARTVALTMLRRESVSEKFFLTV
jgi:hypothetical protein